MSFSYFLHHLPQLFFSIIILVFVTFGVIAYFTGTGLKGAQEKLHKMILYRALIWIKERVFVESWEKVKKIFFQPTSHLYASVRHVHSLLKENIPTKNFLYRVPWYVLVGEDDDKKAEFLKNLPLAHPIESPQWGLPGQEPALQWWFFEKGVVVDVSAKCLTSLESIKKETGWKAFLKALLHYRYQRPLDGLVLAIPASYFYGKNRLSIGDLQEKAENFSRQLMQTEKILGFHLPLYCVVTELEVIPGFEGFAHEVPTKAQQEMFGWSSPYGVNESYSADWIREAFEKVRGYLFEAILSIFSKGGGQTYGDDLMVFLDRFSLLEEGVTLYLNTILRLTDYEKPFIFRGLYYTGAIQKKEPTVLEASHIRTPLVANLSLQKSSWFFLKDLFLKKIFLENGLATPLKGLLRSTNRVITYMKLAIILTALASVGSLYMGYRHLTIAQQKMMPLLNNSLQLLQAERGKSLEEDMLEGSRFKEKAYSILQIVAVNAQWNLHSPFLLPSLLSPLDAELDTCILKIYEHYIARPMALAFQYHAETIIKTPLPSMPLDQPGGQKKEYNPTETSEFLTLGGYVEALIKLEKQVMLYKEFQATGDSHALSQVLNYLYDVELPETFLKDNPLLREKLTKEACYPTFSLNGYQLDAEKRLYELYNIFLQRILDPAYIYRLAAQLQETLEQMDKGAVPEKELIQKALMQMREVIGFASPKGADWLIKSTLDLGDSYKTMLDSIRNSLLLSDNVVQKVIEVSADLHEKALHYLKAYGSPLTGYFFSVSPGTHRLEPSEGLIVLEKALALFLDQPFMAQTNGARFSRIIPEGQILHWDPRVLQNVIAVVENYETFIMKDLRGYPADAQDVLRLAGLNQLENNVEAMLERAQVFFEMPSHIWGKQAEDMARFQADNIKTAGPLLVRMLKKLKSAGINKSYMDLRDLIFAQMYGNLKKLDQTLLSSGYYMPVFKDFSWWKGEKKAIFKAYGMQDKDEMKAYLDNQSQHVMNLALSYGAPLLEILKSDVFSLDVEEVVVCSRWTRLLNEATVYQTKKSTGHLKTLEDFLLEEGNNITDKDCLSKITAEESSSASGDYFLERRNIVRSLLFKQCQKINVTGIVDQYNKIATYFNSFMANTFPFLQGVPDGSKIDADVSDSVLQEFFEEFDKLTPDMCKTLSESNLYKKGWGQAQAFITKMAKVRAFMDKYFAPKVKGGDPGIDFTVDFRQNKMREKYGDFVLDWAVISGDQSASLKEGNKPLRWEFGKNIAFGFQWAMNAPLQPVDNEAIDALTKVGGRSMYVYQGYWALLRAILIHKTSPRQGGSTHNDTLLMFKVPVAPDPSMAETDTAILFIQLIPQTAKGLRDVGFKIPEFPIVAPVLTPDNKEE